MCSSLPPTRPRRPLFVILLTIRTPALPSSILPTMHRRSDVDEAKGAGASEAVRGRRRSVRRVADPRALQPLLRPDAGVHARVAGD